MWNDSKTTEYWIQPNIKICLHKTISWCWHLMRLICLKIWGFNARHATAIPQSRQKTQSEISVLFQSKSCKTLKISAVVAKLGADRFLLCHFDALSMQLQQQSPTSGYGVWKFAIKNKINILSTGDDMILSMHTQLRFSKQLEMPMAYLLKI